MGEVHAEVHRVESVEQLGSLLNVLHHWASDTDDRLIVVAPRGYADEDRDASAPEEPDPPFIGWVDIFVAEKLPQRGLSETLQRELSRIII